MFNLIFQSMFLSQLMKRTKLKVWTLAGNIPYENFFEVGNR